MTTLESSAIFFSTKAKVIVIVVVFDDLLH